MTRAVIYARFSTELQNEKSTEDQIALCRAYADRQKIDVIATFEDRARSGASVFGRDGLMQLMDAARQRLFDVVIVEALDRLSRDMEDLAGLHKRLSFQGIEIQAVHDGIADAVLIGIRGLVGQMQREDGAKKVRRGMAGVVRDGRHAGGRAYGYRAVLGHPGAVGDCRGGSVHRSTYLCRVRHWPAASRYYSRSQSRRCSSATWPAMECVDHQWQPAAGHGIDFQRSLCRSYRLE